MANVGALIYQGANDLLSPIVLVLVLLLVFDPLTVFNLGKVQNGALERFSPRRGEIGRHSRHIRHEAGKCRMLVLTPTLASLIILSEVMAVFSCWPPLCIMSEPSTSQTAGADQRTLWLIAGAHGLLGKLVAGISLVALLCTWLLPRLRSPSFVSEGQMTVAARVGVPEASAYTEEQTQFLGTQVALMESKTVSMRAAARCRKTNNEAMLRDVSLKATVLPKTTIFLLRATGSNPQGTQNFLQTCMEEYIALKKEMHTNACDTVGAALGQELLRLQKELQAPDQTRADLQRIQSLYDGLLRSMQTVQVSEEVQQESVTILENASFPVRTSSDWGPSVRIAGALGLVISCLLLITARFLAAGRHMVFCFVMAILESMAFPFGTVLGICTVVVLWRRSPRA